MNDIVIDHLAVPCREPAHSAQWLAELLDVPVSRDGAEDEFFCLRLHADAQLLFTEAARWEPLHFAMRVAPARFDALVDRLRARGVRFGNDPEAATNGEISDPLGGRGRVYFASPDGHLLEVCT